MLMLDLDDLKPVNDTFGHQWGDRLLKAIADTVRRDRSASPTAAARYGGDEFVVLLPETDAAGGYVVGEKLRRDIAALTLACGRPQRALIGVGRASSPIPTMARTIEQLVAAADVAMYEAKRRGKNRIVGYQTRTERVATDIDADTHAPGAADPVRVTCAPAATRPRGAARRPEPGVRVLVRRALPVERPATARPHAADSDRSDHPGRADEDPAAVVRRGRRRRAVPRADPALGRVPTARPRRRAAEPPTRTSHRGRWRPTSRGSRVPTARPTRDRPATRDPTRRPRRRPTDGPRQVERDRAARRVRGSRRPTLDRAAHRADDGARREPFRRDPSHRRRPWIAIPIEPDDPPSDPRADRTTDGRRPREG